MSKDRWVSTTNVTPVDICLTASIAFSSFLLTIKSDEDKKPLLRSVNGSSWLCYNICPSGFSSHGAFVCSFNYVHLLYLTKNPFRTLGVRLMKLFSVLIFRFNIKGLPMFFYMPVFKQILKFYYLHAYLLRCYKSSF